MSRYVKKHKRQIMGVAAPLFVLFFLISFGLSIVPKWINPGYGTPGQSCAANSTICDPCNGESCISLGSMVCANFPPPGFTTNTNPSISDPFCPTVGNSFPGCYTGCTTTLFNGIPLAQCLPDDSFCQDISGGTTLNACRSAACTPGATIRDSNNPSGCDYDLIGPQPPSTACLNCSEPIPAGFDFCGNGICEPAHGEDCDQCPEDCLLPGFTDTCPLTSGPAINFVCQPQAISFVSFGGPPYNDPYINSDCEDGDLCTDNSCVYNQPTDFFECTVTNKGCLPIADFCCPQGCTPSNDPDCLEPVDCGVCGDNIVNGTEQCDGSDLDCPEGEVCDTENCVCVKKNIFIHGDGILPCALNKHSQLDPRQGLKGLLVLGMTIAILGLLRRRIS